MRAFIKSLDEKAWRSVLTGWKTPTIKIEDGEIIEKPELDWSAEDDRLANYNSRALHAIFNGVDADQIKLISTCESAKDAWDILQITFEGTGDVKRSKLQMLTTRFENLRMLENETIADFYAKLCDISNESFALGEKFSESKLVRKILRSLPDRFQPKVTAIEENKNLDTMKVEELMGSLRTFEMNLKQRKKEKSIALKATQDEIKSEEGTEAEEEEEDQIVFLTKNFNKYLKKMGKGSKAFPKNAKGNSSFNLADKRKGIQCRECEGFGHIQSECANTLKKKSKVMATTWSDDESEGSLEEDGNHVSNHIAFVSSFHWINHFFIEKCRSCCNRHCLL